MNNLHNYSHRIFLIKYAYFYSLTILGSVSENNEININVGLSWLRDAIILSLKQYNLYFASVASELQELTKNISEKVNEKAIKYIMQKTGKIENSIRKLKNQQEFLYEKVRNVKLEEKILDYSKDKEIQEKRYNDTIKIESNILKCTQEIKQCFESPKGKLLNFPRVFNKKASRITKKSEKRNETLTLPPTNQIVTQKEIQSPEKVTSDPIRANTYITGIEENSSPFNEKNDDQLLPSMAKFNENNKIDSISMSITPIASYRISTPKNKKPSLDPMSSNKIIEKTNYKSNNIFIEKKHLRRKTEIKPLVGNTPDIHITNFNFDDDNKTGRLYERAQRKDFLNKSSIISMKK